MRQLNVAFVWHMHQPYYRDSISGEYMLPWVLLHATKDYLHMAQVLEAYPSLHQTFNLVPSLVQQLTDGDSGGATGRFSRVLSTPSAELSDEDREFILSFFFNINRDKVIARYPRYLDLLGQAESHRHGWLQHLPDDFWLDTVGWFNLAWMDPTWLAGDAKLRALLNKPHFTVRDVQLIRRKQGEIVRAILPAYRKLQARGQVELATSPYYHPILPLLVDSHQAAREASPHTQLPRQSYQHPEDAAEQVARARAAHLRHFGTPPAGMWPSEGAVSQSIVPALVQNGFRWIASDEEVLNRSRGWSSRHHDGSVADPASLYSAYEMREGDGSLAVLFRDRGLSDEIGFKYQAWRPRDAAADLVHRLHQIGDALGEDRDAHVVPFILDGENCWEFYDNNGQDFLECLYGMLAADDSLRCVTVSEYLDEHPPTRQLDRLAAGSWIGGTFNVWIGEWAQNVAWDYLAQTRADLVAWASSHRIDVAALAHAWEEIYIAEGSDWFWWFYSGNDPRLERDFDRQFRLHLANVYTCIGLAAPDHLQEPILRH